MCGLRGFPHLGARQARPAGWVPPLPLPQWPRRELRAALRTVPALEPRLPAPDHRSTLAGACPACAHRALPSLCPQDCCVLGDCPA